MKEFIGELIQQILSKFYRKKNIVTNSLLYNIYFYHNFNVFYNLNYFNATSQLKPKHKNTLYFLILSNEP